MSCWSSGLQHHIGLWIDASVLVQSSLHGVTRKNIKSDTKSEIFFAEFYSPKILLHEVSILSYSVTDRLNKNNW